MSVKQLPPLTLLLHEEKLSDGSPIWVATCPELDVTTQGFSIKHAQEMLREAIEGVLDVASDAEIEQRLADGYTPTIEPLKWAA